MVRSFLACGSAIFFSAVVFSAAAHTQEIVPPEIVRLENLQIEDEMRTVYVGNPSNHYLLYCDIKAAGCITPKEDKDYFLITKDTRFKMPGATGFLTLSFIQDWTVKYNKGENVGLIAKDDDGDPNSRMGIFLIDKTGGGYERDTIITDGPIVYGTGLSDEDRQKAWKQFFMMMVAAVIKQQGADALGTKMLKRCMPGENFCTTTLDANLVGIGGVQEPRKVSVMVMTDPNDPNQQLGRIVCTWPAPHTRVCREWNTGKLIIARHE